MENRIIANDQLSASSKYSSTGRYHGPSNARLNRPGQTVGTLFTTGAWNAQYSNLHQWIQVKFAIVTWITGVITQGREDYSAWVTKYKVEYTSNGQNWMFVKGDGDQATVS